MKPVVEYQAPSGKEAIAARSPIISTEFKGNSTEAERVSTDIVKKSTESQGALNTETAKSSTEHKISTDDIIYLLREHPQFVRFGLPGLSSDRMNAVVAAVVSGMAIAGGVAITVVTAGSAPSVFVVLSSSMLMGVGSTGMKSAIQGITMNEFKWSEWGREVGKSGFLTLITFGAGYAAGNLAGIALVGKWTESQVKIAGMVAGGLTGGATRTVAHTIITKMEGKPIEMFNLVFEAGEGILGGAYAGWLGAHSAVVDYKLKE